jgi:hypothetical protein
MWNWSRWMLCLTIGCVAALGWVGVGCTDSASTDSGDPTTRALSDPMGYTPDHSDEDISGGSVTNFDSDAFKKDMDHVLNP